MADGPNEVRTSLPDELGWSPRALARRINHVFGASTVADTAPYHWRDSGCIPRPPLPELAAWVLPRELGHALAGQLDDFDRAHATGLDTIADRDPAEEPAGMDYLTPNHLDTKAGCALTHAGTLAAAAGDHQTGAALLRRGERLFRTGAHALPVDHPAQRRALFEGAWLSVAAAGQGRLEQACTIGSLVTTRRERVQSVRSAHVLRLLARRLRRCGRNEYVRHFLPTLDAALARQPRPA